MNVLTIARVYASAVFDVSIKTKNIEQWKSILELFAKVSKYDIVHSLFFRHLESEKLSKIFIAICEDLQRIQIDVLAKNFIRVVSEKNRLSLLPIILEEFNYLYFAYFRRILTVEVLSAWPLSKDQHNKITFFIERRFSNKKINIVNKINRNLFGGIIIYAENIVIDASVRGKIFRLDKYILKP